MSCVWNGMVAMSIEPFEAGIRFRRGNNVRPNIKQHGECAGSECSTLCLDFLKHGFSKIMMVPRVKVAYEHHVFNSLKINDNEFTRKFPINSPRHPDEDKPLQFIDPPKRFECLPYFDGQRGRDPSVGHAYMEEVAYLE